MMPDEPKSLVDTERSKVLREAAAVVDNFFSVASDGISMRVLHSAISAELVRRADAAMGTYE